MVPLLSVGQLSMFSVLISSHLLLMQTLLSPRTPFLTHAVPSSTNPGLGTSGPRSMSVLLKQINLKFVQVLQTKRLGNFIVLQKQIYNKMKTDKEKISAHKLPIKPIITSIHVGINNYGSDLDHSRNTSIIQKSFGFDADGEVAYLNIDM